MKLIKFHSIGIVLMTAISLFVSLTAYFYVFQSPKVILLNEEDIRNMGQNDPFQIDFSHFMDHKSVMEALSIVPEIETIAGWNGRKLTLKPIKQLEIETIYTVRIDKNAKNIAGKTLSNEISMDFFIKDNPRVFLYFPESRAKKDDTISVMFTDNMSTSQGYSDNLSFTISPDTKGSWTWKTKNIAEFTPENHLIAGTEYTVKIPKETTSENGVPMDQDFYWKFNVEEANLTDISAWEDFEKPITLKFSEQMSEDTLRKRLNIYDSKKDKVSFQINEYQTNEAPYGIEIIPETGWKSATEYSIAYESEKNDNPNPYIAEFKTPEILRVTGNGKSELKIGPNNMFQVVSGKEFTTDELLKNISTNPKINLQLSEILKDAENEYVVKITADQNSGDAFEVIISPEMIFKDGKKYLSSPVTNTVKPSETLLVIGTHPAHSNSHKAICVYSNNPLATDTLKANFQPENENSINGNGKVSDPINTVCDASNLKNFYYTEIATRLVPETDYTITLTNIEDVYGNKTITTPTTFRTSQLSSSDISIKFENNDAIELTDNINGKTVKIISTNTSGITINGCELKSSSIAKYLMTEGAARIINKTDCIKINEVTLFQEDVNYWENNEKNLTLVDVFGETLADGFYMLEARALNDKSVLANKLLVSSHVNTLAFSGNRSILVMAQERETGLPTANAEINGYDSDGRLIFEGITDKDGIYFKKELDKKISFVIAKKENSLGLALLAHESNVDQNGRSAKNYRGLILPSIETKTDGKKFEIHGLVRQLDDTYSIPENILNIMMSIRNEDLIEVAKIKSVTKGGLYKLTWNIPNNVSNGEYIAAVCIINTDASCAGEQIYFNFSIGNNNFESINSAPHDTLEEKKEPEIQTVNKVKIQAEKELLTTGEKINLTILSQIEGSAIVTAETNDIVKYERIHLTKGRNEITWESNEQMVPNINVRVTVQNKDNIFSDNTEVVIKSENKNLLLSMDGKMEKNEKYTMYPIKVTDNKNNTTKTESLIFLSSKTQIDVSAKEQIKNYLYEIQNFGTAIFSSQNNENYIEKVDSKLTSHFREINMNQFQNIEWLESMTDNEGKINIRIENTLAEKMKYLNILTVSHDGKVGHYSTPLSVDNEIHAEVDTPEFIRMGDTLEVPVTIVNNTEVIKKVTASIELHNINAKKNNFEITAPPKSSVNSGFQLNAKNTNKPSLEKIKVNFDSENFSWEKSKNITLLDDNNTKQLAFHSSTFKQDEKITFALPNEQRATNGEFKIYVSDNYTAHIIDDMEFMLGSPITNNESIMGKIYPGVILYTALSLNDFEALLDITLRNNNGEIIPFETLANEIIRQLYTNQNPDGGWGYWNKSKSSILVTASMAKKLFTLKENGYIIYNFVMSQAKTFLENKLTSVPQSIAKIQDAEEQLMIIYTLSEMKLYEIGYINNWFSKKNELSTVGKLLLCGTLLNAGFETKGNELLDEIMKEVHRSPNGAWLYQYDKQNAPVLSDIQRTALLVEIISEYNTEVYESVLDELIRWIANVKPENLSTGDRISLIEAIAASIPKYETAKKIASVRINGIPKKTFELGGNDTKKIGTLFMQTSQLKPYPDVNTINLRKEGAGTIHINGNISFITSNTSPSSQGMGITRNTLNQNALSIPLKKNKSFTSELKIYVPTESHGVVIENPLPTGFEAEIVNTGELEKVFTKIDKRIDKIVLSADFVSPGVYEIIISLTPKYAGNFIEPPATVKEITNHKKRGNTGVRVFEVTE